MAFRWLTGALAVVAVCCISHVATAQNNCDCGQNTAYSVHRCLTGREITQADAEALWNGYCQGDCRTGYSHSDNQGFFHHGHNGRGCATGCGGGFGYGARASIGDCGCNAAGGAGGATGCGIRVRSLASGGCSGSGFGWGANCGCGGSLLSRVSGCGNCGNDCQTLVTDPCQNGTTPACGSGIFHGFGLRLGCCHSRSHCFGYASTASCGCN